LVKFRSLGRLFRTQRERGYEYGTGLSPRTPHLWWGTDRQN